MSYFLIVILALTTFSKAETSVKTDLTTKNIQVEQIFINEKWKLQYTDIKAIETKNLVERLKLEIASDLSTASEKFNFDQNSIEILAIGRVGLAPTPPKFLYRSSNWGKITGNGQTVAIITPKGPAKDEDGKVLGIYEFDVQYDPSIIKSTDKLEKLVADALKVAYRDVNAGSSLSSITNILLLISCLILLRL